MCEKALQCASVHPMTSTAASRAKRKFNVWARGKVSGSAAAGDCRQPRNDSPRRPPLDSTAIVELSRKERKVSLRLCTAPSRTATGDAASQGVCTLYALRGVDGGSARALTGMCAAWHRHIDCAAAYGSQEGVGKGLNGWGVSPQTTSLDGGPPFANLSSRDACSRHSVAKPRAFPTSSPCLCGSRWRPGPQPSPPSSS